jgi:hypothetical protein
MTTNKQLLANKENGKKSTGPRSQAGKARSRLNSRKHGLTAKTLVIGDEDPAQFHKLRAELMEEYDPQSALECELVERLSSLLWRLRRNREDKVMALTDTQVRQLRAKLDAKYVHSYGSPDTRIGSKSTNTGRGGCADKSGSCAIGP